MTIKEKTECCAVKTRFTLFKEGLFYLVGFYVSYQRDKSNGVNKCYNEDAMVFVQKVWQPHRGDVVVAENKYAKTIKAPSGRCCGQQALKETPPLRGLHTMHIIFSTITPSLAGFILKLQTIPIITTPICCFSLNLHNFTPKHFCSAVNKL